MQASSPLPSWPTHDSSPSRQYERRNSRSPDRRSPRRFTPHPSYSHTTRSPARPPACHSPHQPRDIYLTCDLADMWILPWDVCYHCLHSGHRVKDCHYNAFCPFQGSMGHRWEDCCAYPNYMRQTRRVLSQAYNIEVYIFFRCPIGPQVRPTILGIYVTTL